MDVFKFISYGTQWVSWIWLAICSSRLGKFLSIMTLNKIFTPFSFYSLSGTSLCIYLLVWSCPTSPLSFLYSFPFFFFFYSDRIISNDRSSTTLAFLLLDLVQCWNPLVNFSVIVFFSSQMSIWYISFKTLELFATFLLKFWD